MLMSTTPMPSAADVLKYSFHGRTLQDQAAVAGSSSSLMAMDLAAGKGKKRSQYRGNLVYSGP
jgi:hypothetical protein